RLEGVTMILLGSPFAFFTSRKPSAPAPPDLLITTIDCFIRLCLATMPWTARAIWSAPPPVPAGTMNSTVLVGSQACAASGALKAANAIQTTAMRFIYLLLRFSACFSSTTMSVKNSALLRYVSRRLRRRGLLALGQPFTERHHDDEADRRRDPLELEAADQRMLVL